MRPCPVAQRPMYQEIGRLLQSLGRVVGRGARPKHPISNRTSRTARVAPIALNWRAICQRVSPPPRTTANLPRGALKRRAPGRPGGGAPQVRAGLRDPAALAADCVLYVRTGRRGSPKANCGSSAWPTGRPEVRTLASGERAGGRLTPGRLTAVVTKGQPGVTPYTTTTACAPSSTSTAWSGRSESAATSAA